RVPSATAAQPAGVPQGVGSCAATACHGSVRPADPVLFPSHVLRDEYTIWLTRDDHARAYQVLLSSRSQKIAEKLAGGKGVVPAHEDARCLACHATPGAERAALPQVVREDGIGCESCHGPAERWLGPHTQGYFHNLDPAVKLAQYGM